MCIMAVEAAQETSNRNIKREKVGHLQKNCCQLYSLDAFEIFISFFNYEFMLLTLFMAKFDANN